jgi:RES domain-containing protein
LTRVWRILRRHYSKKPLDGEGAFRFGGRWSSPGARLAYTSEHLSLAMIEYFIHIDPGDSPPDLVVVSADIPESVSRKKVLLNRLPANWRGSPAPPELAVIGDSFVADSEAAVLIVPSVLAPSEANWLINPRHSEFRRIRVHPAEEFHYDVRFFA